MDAQNAVEPTSARQPASPKRGVSDNEPKPASKPSVDTKIGPSAADSKSAKSSSNAPGDDATQEPDSDAETIVLPGKDGVSPSKPRKVIKHEDRGDGKVADVPAIPKKLVQDGRDGSASEKGADDAGSSLGRKKRSLEREDKQQHGKDGSSGLSSVPASPPHQRRQSLSHRRRRSGEVPAGSESESFRPRSPKVSKEKAKSVDRLLSNKRKAPKIESDDEGDTRKIRRPRNSDSNIDVSLPGKFQKDHRPSLGRPHPDKHPQAPIRSVSPHARSHRRSASNVLPSHSSNGLSNKKRRVPAPLQSTGYHSDDSSASGSPHPRSSRLRSIVTPITGDSTVSPAKMAPHKKHLDAHGQTLFAKACSKGEYDLAKMRLQERPEDLNFADHAGNTPLQVAALNGHEKIVELLIQAGCDLECRNDERDTPLLDAVENGHLGVVKLLLAAGVNPRKANAEGQEPLEKVNDDLDNAEEMRSVLTDARQKMGERRRTSEDHQPHDSHDASSHGPDSPRRSPEASSTGAYPAGSRRGGRAKTSNHVLYMSHDEKTLRQAAARGDQDIVYRILQVKEGFDDPEALVLAARGGHAFVMELLLALGGGNPDPPPIPTLPSDHNTPMLAAIGQENIEVVELLLKQNGFDPTRRVEGETYYEIARRRQGPNCEREEDLLKDAYDSYKKSHKNSSKVKSTQQREQDQASKRSALDSSSNKRRALSPPRHTEAKKRQNATKAPTSPQGKRQSSGTQPDQSSPKRASGRPKKDDRTSSITVIDHEGSPAASAKSVSAKTRRVDVDVAGSSEGETPKVRRKLISGKDLKGQREKQRRASMVSNISARDLSDRGERHDDVTEKSQVGRLSEKYHDRTKALKRDESMERNPTNDASHKRHRLSVSPARHTPGDKDNSEAPIKRRRLDVEGQEKRSQPTSSPDDRHKKRDASRDSISRQKSIESERRDKSKKAIREQRSSEKSSPSGSGEASITVFSQDLDVDMHEAPTVSSMEDHETPKEREQAQARKRQAESDAAAAEAARKKAEDLRREEKQKREAELQRQREETEKKHLEEVERQQREEAEKKKKEDEELKARREEERRRREEEEKQKREEEEKRKREEEERQKREEEERKRKEQEARKQREEEEARLRREKEAAEELRRQREEEERKERERRRLAAREAEMLKIRQEQERLRLAELPPLLRWLDTCPDPKRREIAELFSVMQGVRYDTIRPEATGRPEGRDQWLLNTQVALLLGEKDLSLARYTAWERISVSNNAKMVIWRLEQDRYALTADRLYHLGQQLPDYYGGDPYTVGYPKLVKLREEARRLFLDLDMFFVKQSDFLYIAANAPHLRNVKLTIEYREIPENPMQLFGGATKWKQDPDASSREGFAPRRKWYVNGQFLGEEKPGHYTPSKTPFPERRVPRRGGIVAVNPEEPDYAQLCVEQGLSHLLSEQQKLALNASHLTPKSMTSNDTAEGINGDRRSPSAVSPTTQVNGIAHGSRLPIGQLPNGTSGTQNTGSP